MQNTHEDTEWNDALRSHGILPQKPVEKEITEDEIVNMLESTIENKTSSAKKLEKLSLDELDELEDEEEERILQQYKAKRLSEMKAQMAKAKFGDVREITAKDWSQEVNKAGEGVWVVVHLYKQGIPMCTLLNQHMNQLAAKFPATKFIKSISTVCIPNYPDRNVPTVFVYFEGELKKQFIGPDSLRGMKLTLDEFEYILGKSGAVKSTIEKDPKVKVKDQLMSKIGGKAADNSDSDDY